jgi:DNA-3-methyladenine glycosylase II
MIHTAELLMTPLPPFSFELSAEIFTDGDKQIRNYHNEKFQQVIRVHDKLVLAKVKFSGSVSKPRLRVELLSNKKITDEDKKEAEKIINVLFNLNFDLAPFYEEVKKDRIMAHIIMRLHGLKSPTTQFAFEALIDSIIEQQISLKVANTFERKLTKKFGDALCLDSEIYYAYPTPESLASATKQELRNIGLSLRKAEYIQAVATLVAEGKLDLETLKTRENVDYIIQELDKIRGVGVWTAELTMIRGMQKLGALPADDLGLRRTISHYYCGGKPISSKEARQIAEGWGRWKGLAAYYLIVAENLGVKP